MKLRKLSIVLCLCIGFALASCKTTDSGIYEVEYHFNPGIPHVIGDTAHILYKQVMDEDDPYNLEFAMTELMERRGVKNLVLHLHNPGGCIFTMMDYFASMVRLQERGLHITTIARGVVASAAVPLFLAGDTRLITAHTVIMVHPGSWRHPMYPMPPGSTGEMLLKWEEWYAAYVAERTKLGYQFVLDIMRLPSSREDAVWFFTDECLVLGFADKLLE